MSRNPFEIRADLLKQAQDHLENQYDANVKFLSDMYFELVKAGSKTMDEFQAAMPKYPGMDEVIEQAKKLYNFVDSK